MGKINILCLSILFVAVFIMSAHAFATDALFIDANGKVGIGTSTPHGKLDVPGSNGTPGIYLYGEDNIWFDSGQVRITTHDGYGNWQIKQGADNDDKYCGAGSGAIKLRMDEDGRFLLYTAPSGTVGNNIAWNLGLCQNISGYVGIGTSSPQMRMDIRGPIRQVMNSNYDLWIQGGASTSGGDARNLAILGKDEDYGDKLYVNYNSEYAGGTIIGGNVGIGTGSPQYSLHIAKNANASSTLGGAPAVLMLEQANNNNWSDGEAAAEILFKKGDDIVGAIRSEHTRSGGAHTYEDAGLAFYVAPASETPTAFEAMKINHLGDVGIGTSSPSYTLDVVGSIHATGNIYSDTWSYSDIRLKENIKEIQNALDMVSRLRGVSFQWRDKQKDQGEQIGVIAQEVEKIFPEIVHEDVEGYKAVDYAKLIAPMIEAVKELKAENDLLKVRLEEIEKMLASKETDKNKK